MKGFDLSGRRALVTGSSEGIGQAIAVRLASVGAEIVAHGLEVGGGETTLAMIAAQGGRASYVATDLADPAAAPALFGVAGAVDILVSTVAVQCRQPLGQIDQASMTRQFDVNVASMVSLVQLVLPHMRARKWGRIITIGSVQEDRPHPEMLVYASLKAAQVNLVESLARQLAADGVTVNNIAPGVILTRRNESPLADPAYAAHVIAQIPAGYFGEPDDVAGAALLLASDAGRYITGASLAVSGGMHLG